MSILAKEDKLQIIESRKRGLEYKKYGLELDLVVANAATELDQKLIDLINSTVTEINAQLAALEVEFASVNSLTE